MQSIPGRLSPTDMNPLSQAPRFPQPRPPQCQIPRTTSTTPFVWRDLPVINLHDATKPTYVPTRSLAIPLMGHQLTRWLELGTGDRQNLESPLAEPGSPNTHSTQNRVHLRRPTGFPRV